MRRTAIVAVVVAGLLAFGVRGADPKPVGRALKLLPPAATRPIGEGDRRELSEGVAKLAGEIESLRAELKEKPELLGLLADVQIYENAVRYPLVYDEELDVRQAKRAIDEGMKRAAELRGGRSPWVTGGGARGYVSRIDHSVQPYLLGVPADYQPGGSRKYPVLIFCHGRGENLLELRFINGKYAAGSADKPSIPGALFVQPYGRFCCANKFAGEIDVLEVLEALKKQYPIDENRIVLTGFSMGGAAVWHLAVHYPDLWCAASPGAGFCETKVYQKLAERGELASIPWYEQTLWHWYDAPNYVMNLSNVPLIAYAGTEDPQQQSGTIMEAAAKAAGVPFSRIWGQGVGHKYEPRAKKELEQRLEELAAKGREAVPTSVKLQTWTLRYNKAAWLSVDGLERHWQQTLIDGRIDEGSVKIKTQNVTALTITLPKPSRAGEDGPTAIEIDGMKLPASKNDADIPGIGNAWTARFVKTAGGWDELRKFGDDPELRKRHGLQGPIDDAFLDTFLMVKPTGTPANERVGEWAKSEMEHAIVQWHRIFRGEAPVKADAEVTDADIASSNLVLWGDPSSNKLLARIAGKLPIVWDAAQVKLGGRAFEGGTHVPILIYPNPLNPKKYVVINSGFTFREDSNSTNSQQTPKLPDYAVVDVTTPADGHSPGKVVAAGFFDEGWKLQADDGRR